MHTANGNLSNNWRSFQPEISFRFREGKELVEKTAWLHYVLVNLHSQEDIIFKSIGTSSLIVVSTRNQEINLYQWNTKVTKH